MPTGLRLLCAFLVLIRASFVLLMIVFGFGAVAQALAPDAVPGSALFASVVWVFIVALFDIYRGSWSMPSDEQIRSRQLFWTGVAMIFIGIGCMYLEIHRYLQGNHDFSTSGRHRMIGEALNDLSAAAGPELPHGIKFVSGMGIAFIGWVIARKRRSRRDSRQNGHGMK
jgi:hypothetical protein